MVQTEIVNSIKTEIANNVLALGFVSADTFESLKKESAKTGAHLYELLRNERLFTNIDFLYKISEKYGVPYDEGTSFISSQQKNFPTKFLEKNGMVLLEEAPAALVVGIAAPSSLHSLKNLGLVTGKKVSAKFISSNVIFSALGYIEPDEHLDTDESPVDVEGSADQHEEGSDEVGGQKQKPRVKLAIKSTREPAKKEFESKGATKSFDSSNIINAVDEMLSRAIDSGVSDIHFEVFKDFANVRYRKNGTLVSIPEYKEFLTDNYVAVIARIKILANLDIAEKRLPQDGKISFKAISGKEVDFRVSVLPTNLGERIVIRILSTSNLAADINALGFTEQQKEHFLKSIEAPQGLILVTGPTGSGKSTTLYGAINYLNKPDVNILTAEDPIEYTMPGISQVQVRENIGLTFANALRSFLRQDPEIILVGEIRDAETADIATKAALTGHLVLSTLHTNSSIGAITRLINMGIAPYLVSSAVTLVVAQRLIRINCQSCSEEEEIPASSLSKELVAQIGSARIMHSKGCDSCFGTGYAGRRAVYEVLPISTDIQKAINASASETDIHKIASEEGFQSMDNAAIKYLLSGELSIQEYLRVIPKSDGVDSL
jgi:type IV pilus assembly protein PilB